MIAILLFGAFLLRLLYLATPRLDSDQAIFGLMAKHILHGELPIFQWGYSYMGTLESFTAAPLMLVFGQNRFALNLAPAIYSLLFAYAASLIAKEAAGRRAGLWALAFGCFPSTYLIWTCVRARGAYSETLALGTLASFLALRALAPRNEREERACLVGTGFVLGLSFWTHLLAIFWGVPILVLWLWERRKLFWRAIPWAGTSFFVGSAPFWVESFRTGFETLAVVGPRDRPVADKLLALISSRLPVILGVTLDGSTQATIPVLAWALPIIQLASFALLVKLATRRDSAPAARRTARLLLVFLIFSLAVYLTSNFSGADTQRYLVPLYTVFVVAPGLLVASIDGPRQRWGTALGLTLVALQTVPAVRAATLLNPQDYQLYQAEDRIDAKLFTELDRLGIGTVYAESYWDGPRLTFESGERLVFANPFHDRHPPYLDRVDAAEHVAFLFRQRSLAFEGALGLAGAHFERTLLTEPPAGSYWIYHSIQAAPGDGPELAISTATASENAEAAELGIDFDAGTRWVTKRAPQPGMWYEVDLGSRQPVAEVAYWPRLGSEAPSGLRVEISIDHTRWTEVAFADSYWGPLDWVRGRPVPSLDGWVDTRFPAIDCRWIRMTLVHPTRAAKWGIAEIKIRGPRTDPPERPTADLPVVAGGVFADRVLAARWPSGVRRWQGKPIPGAEDLRDAFLIRPDNAILLPRTDGPSLERVARRFGFRVGPPKVLGDWALFTELRPPASAAAGGSSQHKLAGFVEDVPHATFRIEMSAPADLESVVVRGPSAAKLAWRLNARTSLDGLDWSPLAALDVGPAPLCWTSEGVLAVSAGERRYRLRSPAMARFVELSPVIPKVHLPWGKADFVLLGSPQE